MVLSSPCNQRHQRGWRIRKLRLRSTTGQSYWWHYRFNVKLHRSHGLVSDNILRSLFTAAFKLAQIFDDVNITWSLTIWINFNKLSILVNHCWCIRVTSKWERWRLKSPASRLFAQLCGQAQIKENIKAPRYWWLWGESTGGFPSQRASNAKNASIWWRHHGLIPCYNPIISSQPMKSRRTFHTRARLTCMEAL